MQTPQASGLTAQHVNRTCVATGAKPELQLLPTTVVEQRGSAVDHYDGWNK